MKIRNGWVGNSSSSSFIIDINTIDINTIDDNAYKSGKYINLESFFERIIIIKILYNNENINWISNELFFNKFINESLLYNAYFPIGFKKYYNELKNNYNTKLLSSQTNDSKIFDRKLKQCSIYLANIIRKFKPNINLFKFFMEDHDYYYSKTIDNESYWKERIYDLGSDIVYIINEH